MDQQVLDLLALWRGADLVQLIKHQNHRHGLCRHNRVHDLTTVGTLVDDLVACVGACIRITAERDELERPAEGLGNAVLDQTRLSYAWGACQQDGQTSCRRIRNLARNELENLDLGLLLAIDCLPQTAPSLLHESRASVSAIRELDRNLLIDPKRK